MAGRLPVAFAEHLRDAPIGDWFDERVRPLVGGQAGEGGEGAWEPLADVVSDDALQELEARLLRRDGVPARAAHSMFAGWSAGYLAWTIAIGVLRDGVLVAASRPGAVLVLRHPDGYYHDVRLIDAHAYVSAAHPWAGRPDVKTLTDHAALEAEAVAEIDRVCSAVIDGIAQRSGRGRAGLWAQVADAVGDAAFSLQAAEPGIGPLDVSPSIQRLLSTPGAPWRHTPTIWIAEDGGDQVLVKHRGSCCLYYRRDPAVAEQPGDEEPDYCTTCLFRSPADVEARALFDAQCQRDDTS